MLTNLPSPNYKQLHFKLIINITRPDFYTSEALFMNESAVSDREIVQHRVSYI